MFQLRRILLSGLVALLMVGMVTAGELSAPMDKTDVTIPIGGHVGSWAGEACINTDRMDCMSLWIDIDISWLLNFFR